MAVGNVLLGGTNMWEGLGRSLEQFLPPMAWECLPEQVCEPKKAYHWRTDASALPEGASSLFSTLKGSGGFLDLRMIHLDTVSVPV